MLDEVLAKINGYYLHDIVPALKAAYADHAYLRQYIELNVSDEWISIDVANIHPKEYNYHRSMAGAFLLNRFTWNNVCNILMNPIAKDESKAKQFIALSEMLFSEESAILKHVLTKTLSDKYTNLTHERLSESLN